MNSWNWEWDVDATLPLEARCKQATRVQLVWVGSRTAKLTSHAQICKRMCGNKRHQKHLAASSHQESRERKPQLLF